MKGAPYEKITVKEAPYENIEHRGAPYETAKGRFLRNTKGGGELHMK